MTKTLNKLGKEGNFLNSIKDTYENILNGERVNDPPTSRLGKRQGHLLHQYCTGGSSQAYQAKRGNKMHPEWKGRSKTTSICRQENPEEPTVRTNKVSKVTECKINT